MTIFARSTQDDNKGSWTDQSSHRSHPLGGEISRLKGDETEWNRHVEQMNSEPYFSGSQREHSKRRRNERLSWDNYTRIWNISDVRYWELYHQRNY